MISDSSMMSHMSYDMMDKMRIKDFHANIIYIYIMVKRMVSESSDNGQINGIAPATEILISFIIKFHDMILMEVS